MLLGCLARAGLPVEDSRAVKRGCNLPERQCQEGVLLCMHPGGCCGAAPTHINELLLLGLGHLAEAVVAARQVPGEAAQGIHSHLLHLASLGTGAGWRQAQAADAAPGPDPGREHIALVKLAKLDLEQTGATGCSWAALVLAGPYPEAQGRTPPCSTAVQLLHLCAIQVCDVLHGAGVVSVVPLLDHRVKQVGKHLETSGTMYSRPRAS